MRINFRSASCLTMEATPLPSSAGLCQDASEDWSVFKVAGFADFNPFRRSMMPSRTSVGFDVAALPAGRGTIVIWTFFARPLPGVAFLVAVFAGAIFLAGGV